VFWMTRLGVFASRSPVVDPTYSLRSIRSSQNSHAAKTIRDVRAMFPGRGVGARVKRLAIPAMAVVALRWDQPPAGFLTCSCRLFHASWRRSSAASRPFVGEMIVLERAPESEQDPST